MSLGFTDPPTAAQTIEAALNSTTTVPVPTATDLSQLLGLNSSTTTALPVLTSSPFSDTKVQLQSAPTSTVSDTTHDEILNRLRAIEKKIEEGFAAVITSKNTGTNPPLIPLDKIFPPAKGGKYTRKSRVKKRKLSKKSRKTL